MEQMQKFFGPQFLWLLTFRSYNLQSRSIASASMWRPLPGRYRLARSVFAAWRLDIYRDFSTSILYKDYCN